MNDEIIVKEEDFRKSAMVLNFAALNQLMLKDLKTSKTSMNVIKNYTREQVASYIENPSKNEKPLRDISIALYNKSNHYKRLIQYFSKMLRLDYIVVPSNIDEKTNKKTLTLQYRKTLQFLELMNIKHEFSKILNVAYREDVFFGYEHIGSDSYFIQKLNPDFCTISSIEDGCYNFAFDFSYFNNNKEQLDMYPKEFKSKYNKYLKNATLYRWQELDSQNTICLKINEDLEYCIPPFSGVFEGIFEISDFKALRKDKQEISNYKVLIQKLPIREDSEDNNDFLIDFDNMMMFHNKAAQALPDQVGLITTPMDIKDISFEKDSADADNVQKATRDYWAETGVSVFDNDGGSTAFEASVKTNESIAFSTLRQIERWVNRRLKFFMSNINFRISFPNLTEDNYQEVFDNAFSASQFGYGTKMLAMAALGLSPTAIVNMTYLENEILGMTETLIPLQSANTTSGNDEGGAPKKKSGLSDEGANTRDKK